MANCVYVLAPWRWVDNDGPPHFAPPVGAVASMDLRSLPHAGNAGVQDGFGFFALAAGSQVDQSWMMLGSGDLRDLQTTGTLINTFGQLTGLRQTRSAGPTDKLVDLLATSLLVGDPLGLDSCKPLVPNVQSELEVYLAGHSRVWAERFGWDSHRHRAKLQAVLQADYESLVATHPANSDVPAMVLDYWCEKYRLSKSRWQVLGLGALPTEEQVQFAQQQIAVAQWAAALQNEVIGPMVEGGSATVEEIKTAVAAFGG